MGCNDPLQNVVCCRRAVEIRRYLKASEHRLVLFLVRHQGTSEHRPPLTFLSRPRDPSRLSPSHHPSLFPSSTSANHPCFSSRERGIGKLLASLTSRCIAGVLQALPDLTHDGMLTRRASSSKYHVLQSPPNSPAPAALLNLAVPVC